MPKTTTHATAGLPVRYGDTTLLKRIAKGGMAEIFFAELRGAGRFRRDVIVKRVLPQFSDDVDFTRMLLEEARIAAHLNHPNIVQVLNCGEHQGSVYLTLEFVDGVSLRGLLVALDKAKRTLPFDVSLYITLQVLAALDYAHTRKDRNGQPMHIVHRDATPENILIGYSGEVKLTDFGVALATGRNHKTQLGVIKGKVYYLAPEQVHSKPVDHRLDQYVVGLVLFEILSGQRIFAGDSEAQVVNQVLDGATAMFKRQPELRAPLGLAADAVVRAVQTDPRERFANCFDMSVALNGLTTPGLLRDARSSLSNILEELFGATHHRDMAERAELQAQVERSEQEEAGAPAAASPEGPREPVSSRTVATVPLKMNNDLDGRTVAGPPPTEEAPMAGHKLANRAVRDSGADSLDKVDSLDSVNNMADLDQLLESVSGASASGEQEDTRVQRLHLTRDLAILGGVVASGLLIFAMTFGWLASRSPPDPAELPSVRPTLNSSVPPPPEAKPMPQPEPAATQPTPEAGSARPSAPAAPRTAPDDKTGHPAALARPTTAERAAPKAAEEKPDKQDRPQKAEKTVSEKTRDERPRPTAAAKARSSLDVACLPWCEITINGQPLRQPSPLRNHKLPPGEYDIKVTNPPTGQSDSRHVLLKAGEHVQIQFRL